MYGGRPFHAVLFAAYPVLFLYARNADEVPLRDLALPLLVAVSGGIALFFALRLLLRDTLRAGIASAAVLIVFFSYGHVWELVKDRVVNGVIVDRDLYLLIPWAAISAGILLIAFGARRFLTETTSILNVVALVLVTGSAFSIVRSGGSPSSLGSCPAPLADAAGTATPPLHPRDIYYLIFDRYGGAETLEKDYGFDNSAFLSDLESRGFTVVGDGRANYPRTAHSLASSLNASYLDCLAERISPDESDWGAIFDALADHQVGRFLQRNGYRYVHLGSWWDGTAKSPFADANYSYEGRRGFAQLLYSTTLARPFGEYIGLSDNEREIDYKRVLFQLSTLHRLREAPGPKFVFAHFLLPHEPYIFDAEGRFQGPAQEQRRGRRGAYVEQLRFTNRSIGELLDELLAGPDDTDPIVVLQSDEGPHPLRYDFEGAAYDWSSAPAAEINQTLRILNAFYLPGIADPGLSQTMTPVNTFRRIFDLYFGTHLGMLPDDTYVYEDDDHPYRLTRVTSRVRSSPSPSPGSG